MALSHPVESEPQMSACSPAPPKRRALRWIAISLASLAGIVTLLLSWPVAHISSETAALITPGMTAYQAERIVGARPGWYDGVGGISTNEPAIKGDPWRAWTGAQGTLVLSPDQNGRVGKATFYPALWVQRSMWGLLVERLTRSTEEQWRWWWVHGDRA